MLDFQAIMNGAVIPEVNPLWLERLWTYQVGRGPEINTGSSADAILQICEAPSADPLAIWTRNLLVQILVRAGALDHLRTEGNLKPVVFEKAATVPMPGGINSVDQEAFVASLV